MKTKAKVHKVEFQEPPPGRRDYQWREVAEQLRAKPGEWAVVHRDLPASVAWAINSGRIKTVRPGLGFQTKTTGNRRDEAGIRWISELWMRYVPGEDTTNKGTTKKNGAKQ